MGVTNTGLTGERDFPSTSWSAIRHAQDPDSPEYKQHLRSLIELYWKPVYFVIRRSWAKSNDDAKDLTQQFFGNLIAGSMVHSFPPRQGTFRALLRAAISHFMINVGRDGRRQKRGGDAVILSFDDVELSAADEITDAEKQSPEQMFDAAWKRMLMTRAIADLERRLAAAGQTSAFEVFKRYHLADGAGPSYGDVAAQLGLSIPQIKHALRHARNAFREILTALVRHYVDGPEDLAGELGSLFEL